MTTSKDNSKCIDALRLFALNRQEDFKQNFDGCTETYELGLGNFRLLDRSNLTVNLEFEYDTNDGVIGKLVSPGGVMIIEPRSSMFFNFGYFDLAEDEGAVFESEVLEVRGWNRSENDSLGESCLQSIVDAKERLLFNPAADTGVIRYSDNGMGVEAISEGFTSISKMERECNRISPSTNEEREKVYKKFGGWDKHSVLKSRCQAYSDLSELEEIFQNI